MTAGKFTATEIYTLTNKKTTHIATLAPGTDLRPHNPAIQSDW